MEIRRIRYKELNACDPHHPEAQTVLSLADTVAAQAHEHEEKIIAYLENAPSYSGVGKFVGDVLNPKLEAVAVPGVRTDGLYVWPNQLAYYVRRYHVRLPEDFVARMASLNWQPATRNSLDWKALFLAVDGPPPR